MHYYRAKNLKDILNLFESEGDRVHLIAGGTDVLVEARQKPLPQDAFLLDISQTADLRHINEQGQTIHIGASVTHQELAESALIRQSAPLLAQACRQIGSLQIRNRGTLGGNICNASPCADTVPPLLALNANVHIAGLQGKRTVPVAEFFDSPYHPLLNNGEVVSAVSFAKLEPTTRTAFYKLGRRKALAISRINMAVVFKMTEEGFLEDVRLAPGSVFPAWHRVSEAETFLENKKAQLSVFEEAGKLVADKMIAISGRRWSTPYKEPVVAALVKRTLAIAAGVYKGGKL